MRRRALLASAALTTAATGGCLADVRRFSAGPVRFGHARARLTDASEPFVRGGLGTRDDDSYAAWLFTTPPASDVSVFSDSAGRERQREWDDEIHNENYDAGFVILAQIRTPRERATTLTPVPLGCDPGWTGWRRARVPLGLERTEVRPELAGADEVVATLLAYVEAGDAPQQATVAFLSEAADSCEAANNTMTAERWTPPSG
jgi:hypothetical protein